MVELIELELELDSNSVTLVGEGSSALDVLIVSGLELEDCAIAALV